MRAALYRIEDSKFARLRALLHLARDLRDFRRPTSQLDNAGLRIPKSPVVATGDGLDIRRARAALAAALRPFVPVRGVRATTTVIVPAYNNAALTITCFLSVTASIESPSAVELVVVDDCSHDATPAVFSNLPGLTYVRQPENAGFIASCNAGARAATGRYLCFLNNDTTVKARWLESLVETLEADPKAGAAGSKLVYPDGRLQEAGGIIWRDGTGWNYGRYGDPRDPEYNYVREVDYCSGASLLVRANLFEKLGGFSQTYAPAYYEDTDLCFALRELGYRVLYQPKSEVIHFEGATSGTDLGSGIKRYQEINRAKFVARWRSELEEHERSDPSRVPAAARRLNGEARSIVVIDSYVPLHDRESGSLRLFHLIKMLRRSNRRVVFYPDNGAPLQPYTDELERLGVEVIYHVEGLRRCAERLETALAEADVAWICRPELFEKYISMARRNPGIGVVYDTIDLHFVRAKRRAELEGGDHDWQAMMNTELACAGAADTVVTVSEPERRTLQELGISNVGVVPNVHETTQERVLPFARTQGVLFIGGYNHPPNVDAATWLALEIMPRVWKREPNAQLTLLGSNPPPHLAALASRRVHVPGYVADVSPFFRRHRVFAAPLRYGAGLKGKIGHALSFGLPVVTSEIGAEGFDVTDGRELVLASDPESFARAIVRVYRDRRLWAHLSLNGPNALRTMRPDVVATTLSTLLDGVSSRATARV